MSTLHTRKLGRIIDLLKISMQKVQVLDTMTQYEQRRVISHRSELQISKGVCTFNLGNEFYNQVLQEQEKK